MSAPHVSANNKDGLKMGVVWYLELPELTYYREEKCVWIDDEGHEVRLLIWEKNLSVSITPVSALIRS